jgi:hypothetical protein
MLRVSENFSNLAVGSQYVVDSGSLGVGKIVSDGAVNALSHHSSYPGKQPAYIPLKVVNREPSINLGANIGHMIDIRVRFRLNDVSTGSGVIFYLLAKVDAAGYDTISFGNDGANWYCAGSGDNLTMDGSWSLAGAPDTDVHTVRFILMHDVMWVWFDDETPGTFDYEPSTSYATAAAFYANLVLCSSSGWEVYWKWYDVILSQVDLITDADDQVRVDGVGLPAAVVQFFDQSVHTPEYELTSGQDGVIDIASVDVPGTYTRVMRYPELGYSSADEYEVAGP